MRYLTAGGVVAAALLLSGTGWAQTPATPAAPSGPPPAASTAAPAQPQPKQKPRVVHRAPRYGSSPTDWVADNLNGEELAALSRPPLYPAPAYYPPPAAWYPPPPPPWGYPPPWRPWPY
jgi:hypothetical protein